MKNLRIGCPYCKEIRSIEIGGSTSIGDTFVSCYICNKLSLIIIGIEEDFNRPELRRYIFSPVYQHCVKHPEIMFNQADCPMCKLEDTLREYGNQTG